MGRHFLKFVENARWQVKGIENKQQRLKQFEKLTGEAIAETPINEMTPAQIDWWLSYFELHDIPINKHFTKLHRRKI